jgi:hypothetical protein
MTVALLRRLDGAVPSLHDRVAKHFEWFHGRAGLEWRWSWSDARLDRLAQ